MNSSSVKNTKITDKDLSNYKTSTHTRLSSISYAEIPRYTEWQFNQKLIQNIFHERTYTHAYISHPVITCSKLTIETMEQGVTYVQS